MEANLGGELIAKRYFHIPQPSVSQKRVGDPPVSLIWLCASFSSECKRCLLLYVREPVAVRLEAVIESKEETEAAVL